MYAFLKKAVASVVIVEQICHLLLAYRIAALKGYVQNVHVFFTTVFTCSYTQTKIDVTIPPVLILSKMRDIFKDLFHIFFLSEANETLQLSEFVQFGDLKRFEGHISV